METPLDIEQFNPIVAELHKAVEATKDITATDLKDPAQLKVVKESRIGLKNMRVAITKKGKELRDVAIKFQKAVIEKEKELIAIIEPEELRLSGIEDEAAIIATREKRRDKLPWRRQIIDGFADILATVDENLSTLKRQYTDDDLLDMDDDDFTALNNVLTSKKNQIESDRIAEERRKIDEEKAAIERQKEIDAAKARAVQEERDRAAREEKDRKAREEREKKEAAERAQREKDELELKQRRDKEEADRKAKEEQDRLERNKKFAKFLADNGCTDATKDQFDQVKNGDTIELWKRVGTYRV
jgi:hypothetical protein